MVMSNRAYLRCLGKTAHGAELIATSTIPDGWLDLFGRSDLHVGSECKIADACKPTTTSYLLASAPVALARFAERMTARGHVLDGDELVARIHQWLQRNFAEGWLFADTSELEAMMEPGVFVENTRQRITKIQTSKRRTKLTPATMLSNYGLGTGLSSEEVEQSVRDARHKPIAVETLEGRPYNFRELYVVGETVAHPVFGSGKVVSLTPTTVSIAFAIGNRVLAHGKK
jgi:hypothetical protein